MADFGLGGLGIAGADGGDVAKADGAAVGGDGDLGEGGSTVDGPIDANGNAGDGGFDGTGRGDGVLAGEGLGDLRDGNAQGSKAGMAEFDEKGAGLFPLDGDLLRARDAEETVADVFGLADKLGIVSAGKSIKGAVDIGVFVIHGRADDALGDVGAEIFEFFAGLIIKGRNLGGGGVVTEIDGEGGETGANEGDDMVEIGEVLQFALNALGDLVLGFSGGGAGPDRGDDEEFDGEGGVFSTAEATVGQAAGGEDEGDEEAHQAFVQNGPGREVEVAHCRMPLRCRRDACRRCGRGRRGRASGRRGQRRVHPPAGRSRGWYPAGGRGC